MTYFQCLRVTTFVACDLCGDGDILVTPGSRVCKLHHVPNSPILSLNQWNNCPFLPVQQLLAVGCGYNERRHSERRPIMPSTPAQLELVGAGIPCSLQESLFKEEPIIIRSISKILNIILKSFLDSIFVAT